MRSLTLSRPARGSGFTLIEVMVVVVIIAVLSSMVVIATMPGDAALAEKEARRLAALLELAYAEARASGQGVAWSPEQGGYSFWQMTEDGEWRRFPDTSVYRRREFSGQTDFGTVLVDARELQQDERVTISPYGSRGQIEATITGGNAQFILRGGVLGRISLRRDSDGKAAAGRAVSDQRLHPG